ncbi:ferritin-like domain-containing protein [Frankia sp. AgKG'84/4]|uniref:ferritin-like domain-containing protein n=1 Tax=Frankia sp. AgKG'84/4 TaxID=573490 RepID=UPI00200FD68E|nr:ferritin-like domain-containing protein [Frankia sp. AgKG'84/4]MCL9796824.1 ferritin-like domain-containing protein [Frankia sp. AgKG'84/4]
MSTVAPESAHSFEVFTHYERLQWKVSDLDLDNIRQDLVQPSYIPLVKGVVMGEATSLPGLHGFLSEFDDDYDCSAFVAVWAYQELQHHYAFRAWLRGVDVHIDQAKIESLREPYEAGVTPSATLTTNVISEIIVNTVYRALSEWVEEPVLADLFLRASRDEAGHAREFLYYLKRRLEAHPHELKSVLERIHFYVTSSRLNHPVGVYKHQRVEEMRGHETVDDVIDVFIQISPPDALDRLQAKLRRMLGTAVGYDLSRNAGIRHAMADLAG